jgi:hypothetical protein
MPCKIRKSLKECSRLLDRLKAAHKKLKKAKAYLAKIEGETK